MEKGITKGITGRIIGARALRSGMDRFFSLVVSQLAKRWVQRLR